MRSLSFALLASAFPLLVVAHGEHAKHQYLPRQPAASSSSSGAASSGTVTSAASTTISVSFSLFSSNPTAVPLGSIIPAVSSASTVPLYTTASAGSSPSSIPSSPPLPNISNLNPKNYPALDIVPPTDSPEVQAWKQEVANSGVTIPNITATVAGGCPANLQAAQDSSRCWWTCGGCTRNSDITTCPTKLDWGVSFDDGPSLYTPNLMEYLEEQRIRATFFVVGSRVISFPATLQSEYIQGHQIAVHTWSHPSLSTLSNDQIIAELGWSRKAVKDVLGVSPNMMRPPYGDIDDRVRAISTAMGMTPVMWTRVSPSVTFDTNDFDIQGGTTTVGQVLSNWENIISNASTIDTGFIVLEHDLFLQTVEVATGYILPDAIARNLTIMPIVSCLNKPMADAYIETNENSTNPPAASGSVVTFSAGAPGSLQTKQSTGGGSTSGTITLNANGAMGALFFGLASVLTQFFAI